ncbi:MAG: hypothetical protein AAFS10_24250, partial [Myxococcota bacterium]
SLHTAAHEATHVIQQRHGVQLSSGVGASGDMYEQHADRVADVVVSGGNAEPLLSQFVGSSGRGRDSVQAKEGPVQMAAATTVAIAGLAVSLVSTLIGAASLGNSVLSAQNDKSGGAEQILSFGGKYFLTALSEEYLKTFAEVLIRMKLDALDPEWETRGESEELDKAKSQAGIALQELMARKAGITTVAKQCYWWGENDTHGQDFEHPGGWVQIMVFGDELSASDIPGLEDAAAKHGFNVGNGIPYLERVTFNGEGFTRIEMTGDDHCYVRPGTFSASQAGGEIKITGNVYFDWDDNTTRMEWNSRNAITLHDIPTPSYEDGPPNI